jgi:spermidine/putrescine transport system substrate-binding protein
MKRVLSLLLALTMALSLCACGAGSGTESKGEVNVYNWGEYIDEEIFDQFEEETGIKVNYTTYSDNESMYATLKSGAAQYDVIIPSDYMISRLISEDALEPLNFDNIPNYANIDEDFKGREYDPDNMYSVPYMWGVVGVVYNKTMVSGTPDSWDILWDKSLDGQILMFDNSRDALAIALEKLGYSLNTTDEKELNEALALLEEQKPLVQAYVMDQIFDKMEAGEAAVGPYYAGDAVTMIAENPDLGFFFPKEGSNYYVDAMCIPKGAENKENAEAFINFMCEPEIIKANADVTNYSVPSSAAQELLEDEMKNNPIIYPDESVRKNTEVFVNLPEDILALYDQLWTELKAS